jgi:hypothetical protein
MTIRLSAAYDAYRASLAGKATSAQNGFSVDQQFFIAFARIWGSKDREAALRQDVMTDSRSPDEFRVATGRNLDAWYAAFASNPETSSTSLQQTACASGKPLGEWSANRELSGFDGEISPGKSASRP